MLGHKIRGINAIWDDLKMISKAVGETICILLAYDEVVLEIIENPLFVIQKTLMFNSVQVMHKELALARSSRHSSG